MAAILVGFCYATSAAPVFGEDNPPEHNRYREDHDEARYLVNRGNIRPLPEVLQAVQSHISGDVIDVQLRSKDLRWIYSCKVVTPAGRRVIVTIDAATLSILEEGHGD